MRDEVQKHADERALQLVGGDGKLDLFGGTRGIEHDCLASQEKTAAMTAATKRRQY